MSSDKMLARKENGIGWMTFNNPERHNAVSLDMWAAATAILAGFAADPEVRVVVVTGAGGKAFVSGADISKFKDERSSTAEVETYNQTSARLYDKLTRFPKPTIAMIRGYCIGGGVGLALCCDMRICTEASKFGVPAAKLGLGYSYAGIRRLVEIVGPSCSKEIFFTARQFTAAEAQLMGLVNRVVPDGELEDYVGGYAKAIADNAPLTIAAVKQTVGEILKDARERDLDLCDRLVKECFASQDYIEGRTAFMEKRKPVFVGR